MTIKHDQVKFIAKLSRYKKKELRALYNNAVDTNRFNEEEFEVLAQAIEDEMRNRFPTEAKRIFGGQDTKHRRLLKELLQQVVANFDTSANKHKTKVKCGAGVFKGNKLIDVYISFKLSKVAWCGIYIQQLDSKSPTILTTRESYADKLNKESYKFDNEIDKSKISYWLQSTVKRIGFNKK
jgi:hypothetical protein